MNTNDLALFLHTAAGGSISRAAEKMDITTASASAALKRLEKQLNVQLFVRSTRQLRITAEGEHFLGYCRAALASLDAGKASLRAVSGQVSGNLRVTAPSDLGRNRLLQWIDDIMEQHSQLSISLLLTDVHADFYRDRIDLAVRYGCLHDSSMVAFKLASMEKVLCASPEYLARYGAPQQPQDLLQHNCLLYQLNGRTYDQWELIATQMQNSEPYKIKVCGKHTCNDGEAVRRWALMGRGIMYKSKLDVVDDLRQGRLVRVLPDYASPGIDLNLVTLTREQVSPAALLLRDLLRDKFTQLLDG
ncbi:LysR family transcriptional regulator [Bacterioplanes sanyensis]|uniref:LysR family transcriptional regulator n=1 Tax=Bacterioplanes sanyensis TaxID=1249553 RepID=A0A222FK94_9GAMM|nr:LysR family transcriptional regulator [Bacterioplanes sanyensis]ASP39072.1 LysR family transcriptional regulator [Bacterioplanes sanyensis]